MKLSKGDVETLLNDYDGDPVPALTVALCKVLDLPDGSWPELIAHGPFGAVQRASLLRGDEGALDALLTQLNELRGVPPEPG